MHKSTYVCVRQQEERFPHTCRTMTGNIPKGLPVNASQVPFVKLIQRYASCTAPLQPVSVPGPSVVICVDAIKRLAFQVSKIDTLSEMMDTRTSIITTAFPRMTTMPIGSLVSPGFTSRASSRTMFK